MAGELLDGSDDAYIGPAEDPGNPRLVRHHEFDSGRRLSLEYDGGVRGWDRQRL